MLIGAVALSAFTLAAKLPQLPAVSLLVAALAAVLLACCVFQRCSGLLLLALFLLFLIRAVSWGQAQLQQRVDPLFESRDIIVEGVVDGLPEDQGRRQRFDFAVTSAYLPDGLGPIDFPSRIRLSDYRPVQRLTSDAGGLPVVVGGQGWRLLVRVKRPHGFANPGGFDYELWLLSRGIGGTGYVREWIRPLASSPSWSARIDGWRDAIRVNLTRQIPNSRILGIALALTVGDKSSISADDNEMIRRAGLSHLMAISGLHISLVAGLGFWLGRLGGAAVAVFFPGRCFGPQVGIVFALMMAGLYSLLSGFGIPVQRALIMLLVWSLWFLSNRYYSPWVSWWLSMVLVLWLQPVSVLLAGFWFSFAAVAALIHLSQGAAARGWGVVKTTLFLQLGLFFLLGAVQLFWGLGVNPLSAIINLVAIPYVSLLVIPALLVSVVLCGLWSSAGELLIGLCGSLIEWFWLALDALDELGVLTYFVPSRPVSLLEMLLLIAGLLALVSSLPRLARFGGGLMFSLLVFRLWFVGTDPALLRDQITVLDVGQGLAVVVESAGNVLLYDTGPIYSESFDAGKAVVLPFLNHRGVTSLQHLVVSHNDSDHKGGYASVVEAIPANRVWFGEVEQGQDAIANCESTRSWLLGKMTISIIGLQQSRPLGVDKANNLSCVVLIEWQDLRLLLPGDIEASRELALLSHPLLQQPVDVVVAAHHGSNTSSIWASITQLAPDWVVFSAGYKNRYHHPHQAVLARYLKAGAQRLCSADSGAISFQLSPLGTVEVSRYRRAERRYWRQFSPISCEDAL